MNDKRSGIKKIIGTGAIVGFWPRSWVKPIVSSVILPAHANTSTSPTCNTVEDIAGGFMSVAITDSGGAQTLLLEPIGTPNILQYVFTGNSFDIDSTEQFTLLNSGLTSTAFHIDGVYSSTGTVDTITGGFIVGPYVDTDQVDNRICTITTTWVLEKAQGTNGTIAGFYTNPYATADVSCVCP